MLLIRNVLKIILTILIDIKRLSRLLSYDKLKKVNQYYNETKIDYLNNNYLIGIFYEISDFQTRI